MAKTHRGNVSFQIETARALLSPVTLCLVFMVIAAALPLSLIMKKRDGAQPTPYLTVDVSAEPQRLSPNQPEDRLPQQP